MKDVAKAGWETRPLGDVCKLLNGRAYKKLELLDAGPYPVLRVGNFFTNNQWYYSDLKLDEDKYCDDGDLLYAWSASFGPRIWRGGKVIFHYHIWKVLPSDRVDRDFLYYFFDWDKELIKKEQGAGATMIHASKGSMEARAIPLPPLEEQQRIVEVLDEAFEGLARARTHAEANLQNARELFERELAVVFSAGKADWRTISIEETCVIRSGTTLPKSKERPLGDIPYVKVGDMNLADNAGGILTSSRFLDEKDISDRMIIPAGATIFPKRGGAIMTNKKRKVLVDICADLNVMGVIPGPEIDGEFLHFFFLSVDMREIGSGAAIPQINNYDINPLRLSYPIDLNVQAEVAEALKRLKDQTTALSTAFEAKLKDLDDLRQSLLQKAFAGELT